MIMKSKATLCTVLAVSLFAGQFAFAQGDAPGANRNRYEQNQRNNDNNRDRDRRDDARQQNRYYNNDNDGRGHGHNNQRGDRDNRGDYRAERGAGPNHSYYRGGHLPYQYRTRQYVVEDWRGHRLSAPPRGYHWVQSGSDYILVAIATGVILQLLLNN
ncbi:RcnB family protein [Rhodoferax sp. AJA081-3]|uniref:RcnB family protein n=1 Tax=Rhodoferax sp. AJA081-3 TaxID=2752316 RepID=UPI0035300B04